LGILEYILVTPSHHRVHHASNEKYLDKNYGDVLIIWDKLFGTFQKEEEEPVYGLTHPLKTYSFLWQHFHFLIELWLAVKAAKSWKEKLKTIFGKPKELSPTLRHEAEQLFNIRQNPEVLEKPLNRYVIIQMILILAGTSLFIALEDQFSISFKTVFVFLLVLLTLINCGAIMEQKKWVFQVELVRLSILFLLPFYYPENAMIETLVLLAAVIILSIYYHTAKGAYLFYVYHWRERHKK
jgi:alkylglycerol monooxygenase